MDSSSFSSPMDEFEPSSSRLPPPKGTFLETYPTPLHSSSSNNLRVYWSHDDPQPIQDKIRCAFQTLQLDDFAGLIQFWAPVWVCARQLLTTSNQPFALSKEEFNRDPKEHRLCCVKYRYNVDLNNLDAEDDPTIIANGPPASAFLNQIPGLSVSVLNQIPGLSVSVTLEKNPVASSASDCRLFYSVVLPVFYPSQNDCVGVLECSTDISFCPLQVFNKLNIALENQGLKTFHAQQHLPYKTTCGLQNVKDEISEALKIISEAHCLPFAQVWIPYEYENQVDLSSSLQDTQIKQQMLWLKLTGHSCHAFLDDENVEWLEDYGTAHDRLPMKMDEMFSGKTLENYEPHFIQDILRLDYVYPQRLLLSIEYPCSHFVICLSSTKTGDLNYVFEFLWSHQRRNNVILLEQLLLTLERYLSSFKFASGTKLGDEIDILDVNNSTESENKYIKIFQRNKVSLKRARQSNAEECLMPLKTRGKTTPIELSREQIESQFGQTMEEAAPKLNVSVSTLKRYRNRLGIKWHGKDRSKRNVKHSYKNQSNTNEEEDQGGAIQDPSSAIIRERSVDENILTIKAEYADDVIKFTLPISATYEAIWKEIVKKFELDPAAHYKLKYLDDKDEWILFKYDEDVTLCTKNKRNIRLRCSKRDPSGTNQLT